MKGLKKENPRRQFLKNTSLAVLAAGLLPKVGMSESSEIAKPEEQEECDPTTLDFYGEGPFYTPNPPVIVNSQLAVENEVGTRLIITGRVRNLQCDQFIPETLIDVWHADDAGAYDNSGFNLRGTTLSNAQGFYTFETIYPGKYLNGASFRPAHIHFRITPPGFPLLTTQLYFEGDPDNASDAASSINSGIYNATERIISLTEDGDGNLEGVWDIVIDGDGINAVEDLHLNTGMIYSATPNPFSNRVEINYGVFRESKVSLLVFDMAGKLVATLEERTLGTEKYTAIWEPENSLGNGHYFIALKINDLQVHYLKVVRNK